MATKTDRDTKLVQYLNEAYGKEKELEAALEAHIGMTTRAPYKKRLQQHLRETKDHARRVERRIKQLGGDPQTVQRLTGQATAALKGPVHALRGSGEEERLLKNAKTEYSEEAEEIATYAAIEAFAESVSDSETAKLARAIKREEERMATYLERLIALARRQHSASEHIRHPLALVSIGGCGAHNRVVLLSGETLGHRQREETRSWGAEPRLGNGSPGSGGCSRCSVVSRSWPVCSRSRIQTSRCVRWGSSSAPTCWSGASSLSPARSLPRCRRRSRF